jgi:hypothetical protein
MGWSIGLGKHSMAASHLRVYYGPPAEKTTERANEGNSVRLSVGEVLPLLAEAVRSERTWLADFAGDDITISTDLYEVLLAYQHYRRPSA